MSIKNKITECVINLGIRDQVDVSVTSFLFTFYLMTNQSYLSLLALNDLYL